MLDLRVLSKASYPDCHQISPTRVLLEKPTSASVPFSSRSWEVDPWTASASPSACMLQINFPLLWSGKAWGQGLMSYKTSQVADDDRRLFLPMERLLLSPACFLCKVSQNWGRSQSTVGRVKLTLSRVSQPLMQAQKLTVEL